MFSLQFLVNYFLSVIKIERSVQGFIHSFHTIYYFNAIQFWPFEPNYFNVIINLRVVLKVFPATRTTILPL